MAEIILTTIKNAAIAAIKRNIFALELYNQRFTLEPTAGREYAVMAEINGSPLCVAHVIA